MAKVKGSMGTTICSSRTETLNEEAIRFVRASTHPVTQVAQGHIIYNRQDEVILKSVEL